MNSIGRKAGKAILDLPIMSSSPTVIKIPVHIKRQINKSRPIQAHLIQAGPAPTSIVVFEKVQLVVVRKTDAGSDKISLGE